MAVLLVFPVIGQDSIGQPSDSTKSRNFKRLDIFPAISYSPETNLTLGVIGIKYFDLAKGDPTVPLSNVGFLALYTLNKQVIIESKWELFMNKNHWRIGGEASYNRFPDRNYGIGNTAGALVV